MFAQSAQTPLKASAVTRQIVVLNIISVVLVDRIVREVHVFIVLRAVRISVLLSCKAG
jgi:hypothetical protein